jgi:biopolymer transport protein ExbD
MARVDGDQVVMRRGRTRGRGLRVSSSLAEINVVPLVDVMLVLLVIFMVTAPLMQQGYAVNLAQSKNAPPAVSEPVFVTIPTSFAKDGKVQIGDEWVHLAMLHERVRQVMVGRTETSVTIRADGAVQYQDIARVWDELNGIVTKVTLATQPRTSDK